MLNKLSLGMFGILIIEVSCAYLDVEKEMFFSIVSVWCVYALSRK